MVWSKCGAITIDYLMLSCTECFVGQDGVQVFFVLSTGQKKWSLLHTWSPTSHPTAATSQRNWPILEAKKPPAILGVRRQDMPEWDILYIRNGRQTGRYIDHCGCTVYYELSLCDGSVLYWLRDPVPWAVHTPRASLPVGWLLLSVFTGAISCNNPGLVDTILLHKHQARIFYMHPAAHTCTNWIYQVRGSQLEMISLCAAVVTSVWENKCTVAKALFCTCPSERVLV